MSVRPTPSEVSGDGAVIAESLSRRETFAAIFDRHFVAIHCVPVLPA